MGDKINNNGFLQIDADKDILSSFLNAEALNYHSSHNDDDINLQYNSKSPKRGYDFFDSVDYQGPNIDHSYYLNDSEDLPIPVAAKPPAAAVKPPPAIPFPAKAACKPKPKSGLKVRIADVKEEVKEQEEEEEEEEAEGEDQVADGDRTRKRGRQKKQKWTENAQARRERNRKSARESRLRKKNFVSNLEDKVKELEAEVKRQRIIIENQNNVNKITKYSQIESMQQLLHGRQIQYEKLHFLLENK